eukprot:13890083-Heterocapsa_arctica.AAC.1
MTPSGPSPNRTSGTERPMSSSQPSSQGGKSQSTAGAGSAQSVQNTRTSQREPQAVSATKEEPRPQLI